MNPRGKVMAWVILGFCGGVLASYVLGKGAQAGEPRPNAKVVTAQKFVLVNDQGASAGIFGFDPNGSPEITLFDAQGNVVWTTKLRIETLR